MRRKAFAKLNRFAVRRFFARASAAGLSRQKKMYSASKSGSANRAEKAINLVINFLSIKFSKMSTLKIALNLAALPVAGKINRSQTIIASIAANPQTFANPGAALTNASNAVNNLQAASLAAVDGGKSKTAIMHDREAELLVAMNRLAAYVEAIANGDAAIVHLSGMDVRTAQHRKPQAFEVQQLDGGSVLITSKKHDKSLFKWQYSADPQGATGWTEALITSVSKAIINGLSPGFYWFRVILADVNGEHEEGRMRFAVK